MTHNTKQSDFNTYWAAYFLFSLRQQGIQHIFISPGSRSTPLTLAASFIPDMETYVLLDERSSGFTALGAGKHQSNPAVLICTSGTAAANYYPAVIEARQAGVPLILCTADRPPSLRSTGANQTIDQLHIFGNYPVFFHEVGQPQQEQFALQRLRTLASQAYNMSIERRGPVHLNFPFAKPLEPSPSFFYQLKTAIESGFDESSSPIVVNPKYDGTHPPNISVGPDMQRTITDSKKPLIIAGPEQPFAQRPSTLYNLGQRLRAPIIAEAGSQLLQEETKQSSDPILMHGYERYLTDSSFLDDYQPDLLIRFNTSPTSGSVNNALLHWQAIPHLHFDTHPDWHDPNHTADCRITCHPDELEESILNPIFNNCLGSEKWIKSWRKLSKEYLANKNTLLSEQEDTPLTDGTAIHYAVKSAPAGLNLFLSNSLPVRDIELFASDRIYPFKQVITQRGASGIDGITSAAIGYTLESGTPGLLVIGDLSFLHDTNALLNAKYLSHSLRVLILNNGGGSIFRMLPIAEAAPELFQTYFETPQSADMAGLASAYSNVSYQKATTAEELDSIMGSEEANEAGMHLIECPTDPDRSMELRNALKS